MYWVSGCASTGEPRISSTESGRRRQACGVSAPFANAFTATCASVSTGIAWSCMYRCSFAPKNCVVTISPMRAVPVGQRPVGGIVLESAARMLVEADDERHLGRARLERPNRRHERRAAGRAAVPDVDEREPGRAEVGHHRVGVAGVLAAAVGDLDVAPGDAGIGERAADRVDAHREAADAVVPPERVDPGSDDGDLRHGPGSVGANAYVLTPPCSIATTSIAWPIRRRAGSLSVSSPSTRSAPGSST